MPLAGNLVGLGLVAFSAAAHGADSTRAEKSRRMVWKWGGTGGLVWRNQPRADTWMGATKTHVYTAKEDYPKYEKGSGQNLFIRAWRPKRHNHYDCAPSPPCENSPCGELLEGCYAFFGMYAEECQRIEVSSDCSPPSPSPPSCDYLIDKHGCSECRACEMGDSDCLD